ncbi:MAG: Phosphoglycerate mutase [uncultured Truepera sp.]|uniref:Phosphoglycerate mutase n=1 Tax=uncultured Truepera sp. TaxID=543023 RepID=A0A6J4VX85_9DEIN|nr:MAG: Phosphoglycerate mutase [uncultured Truepera sp.]
MLELWLVRHAETLWNAERRIQGQSDTPLSGRGLAQAERLAQRLKGTHFDRLYSSDSRRALHTAEIALGGRAVQPEPRLREMSYGTLEGKARAELAGTEREAFTVYWHDPYKVALPGGESWRELDARVFAWLRTLPAEGRVAAFSHGGTIRSALFYVTGIPRKREWNVLFGNTSLTRLRLGKVNTVVSVNDTAHLIATGLEDDGES